MKTTHKKWIWMCIMRRNGSGRIGFRIFLDMLGFPARFPFFLGAALPRSSFFFQPGVRAECIRYASDNAQQIKPTSRWNMPCVNRMKVAHTRHAKKRLLIHSALIPSETKHKWSHSHKNWASNSCDIYYCQTTVYKLILNMFPICLTNETFMKQHVSVD